MRRNFDEKNLETVLMYFARCNFDGWKIDAISTYLFWCWFEWQKVVIALISFPRSRILKNKVVWTPYFDINCFDVFIQWFCFTLKYLRWLSTQFSRTFRLAVIWSDLVYLPLLGFLAKLFLKFRGNYYRRCAFPVSCRLI